METKEIKRPRIIADIDPELFKQLKHCAVHRGMTIKQWIEIAIKMLIKHDERN